MIPTTTNNRGFWTWIPIATQIPPSMTIPEKDKENESYHALWTRYFLSRQVGAWIEYYRGNYSANMDYAIDSRWGEEEDVRMFLGDGPSQTSRIPFKFPIVSPMLTRMVGAVDNISISAKAEPVTQYLSQTRREDAFLKAMLMSEAAGAGPMMATAMAKQGVSPSPEETEKIFDMTYQDHIIRGANSLMSMLAERSKLDDTKRVTAAYMALSGVAAAHCSINGNNLEWEVCEPREVGWDTSAMRPDFADGQFAYTCPLMNVSGIAERWNPIKDKIYALDTWARILPGGYNFNAGWPQSRPRVFTMYWKDMKYVERGFVEKDGMPQYVTINEDDPDTGKPAFTDEDLIEPPENQYTRAWTSAELRAKKQRRAIEVIRYCSMIPWEYLPGGYTKGRPYSPNEAPPEAPLNSNLPQVGVVGDMVLDYGMYPLQEAEADDVYSVKFPIKFSAWRYLGGHAVAPITAARDPQRWMNQITSDIAWRMRKAGGKSVLLAKEALDGSNMDEDELNHKVKEGDTIVVPAAMLGGLQNASGQIDASPGASFYNMLGLLPQIKSVAESSVGVYESNYGAPQGGGQLVGTLQLQLQQAGVMQQPFYASIADLYKQIHQFNAQAGKQFYSRRPWLLSQMVGEDDMTALITTEDMQLEQFRVKVSLSPDGAQLRTITDQQLIPQLMQMGMLDPTTASTLMGRSFPEDVYAAARQFTKQAAEAAAQQAQAQQVMMAEQAMSQEQAAIDQQGSEIAKQENNSDLKLAQLKQKAEQPARQAESEWMKPDSELGAAVSPGL
jgi:hypothetical protein